MICWIWYDKLYPQSANRQRICATSASRSLTLFSSLCRSSCSQPIQSQAVIKCMNQNLSLYVLCTIFICMFYKYVYIYNQIYPFKYQMRRIARFSCQSPAFKREYSCCFLFSTSICSVTRLSRRRFSSSLACL